MDNIKVSVLVPVYNVENEIGKCARSLFEQTMTDGIEFIFVDDATPDSSIEVLTDVLEEYPARKNQVSIIRNTENRGISSVRQTALSAARGEYFIHCDSDDYVESDMYEKMYNAAVEADADMVGCNYYDEYPDSVKEVKLNFALSPEDSICALLSNKPYLKGYLWCRMFKRSFFQKHKFDTPHGLSMLDDMAIVVPAYIFSPKITSVDAPLYHYRRRTDSISGHFSKTSVASALAAMDYLRPFCNTPATQDAWNRALALHAQPLVTQLHTYNPALWRQTTKGIPLKCFGSLMGRLSPTLIRLHLDKLNYLLLKLYRRS